MDINNFSRYELLYFTVVNKKTNKAISLQGNGRLKLFKDGVGWLSVTFNEVLLNAGYRLMLPECAAPIMHSNGEYFIDTKGNVYAFTTKSKLGIIMTHCNGSHGYKRVRIWYKGRQRSVEVHQLMAVTYLNPTYIEDGLVCMHLDNNKGNNALHNLRVGTYSENNKQAYADGINPGNGLKKETQ